MFVQGMGLGYCLFYINEYSNLVILGIVHNTAPSRRLATADLPLKKESIFVFFSAKKLLTATIKRTKNRSMWNIAFITILELLYSLL